jgi:predicted phage-related endonuclease
MSSFIPPPEELASAAEQYLMERFEVTAEDVKVTSVDYMFERYMDKITINVSVRLPPQLNFINLTFSTKKENDDL